MGAVSGMERNEVGTMDRVSIHPAWANATGATKATWARMPPARVLCWAALAGSVAASVAAVSHAAGLAIH